MPGGSRRRSRFAAAVSVLLGALFGLLLCAGAVAGATTAGADAPTRGVVATAGAVASVGVVAGPPVADERQAPGCGNTPRDDHGTGPGTPPRGGSSYELLPALYDARAACGSWGAEDPLLAAAPDRGPPPLAPPSPSDLSVLRV